MATQGLTAGTGKNNGGLGAWLASWLKSAGWRLAASQAKRPPRLSVVERIPLAPRHQLALIEADGQRLLVALNQEGTPAFYPLATTRQKAAAVSSARRVTQGSLNQTQNPLDVAIQGGGFFQVQRPDGTTAYTRAGQFHLNNQGTIVTTDGDPIIPTITIPPNATAVTITQDGMVNATLPGQTSPSQLGQIQLATFPNPGGLMGMGSNLLAATLSSGDAVLGNPGGTEGLGSLQQGYLENSNVDVVTEFVQMVLAQRAYESNSKVIRAADSMYQQVNNMTQ